MYDKNEMKKIPAFSGDYIGISEDDLKNLFNLMLSEDGANVDVTSSFTPDKFVKAEVIVKNEGIIAGIDELTHLFDMVGVKSSPKIQDGDTASPGDIVFSLEGGSRKILSVERTALNILSLMSGIATFTSKFVDALAQVDSKAKVAATRKTTPLFRYFEKKAVIVGGGVPHRMNLSDMVLIKDNHLKVFGGVGDALDAVGEADLKVPVEIEVTNLDDAVKAAEMGVDIVMLDNMSPEKIMRVTEKLVEKGLRGDIVIEVSGNVNLENVQEYGKLDVDVISIGSLTHSAPSMDISLEIIEVSD
ncbi:MAG: carboxylating nicotinate-nucleotide diphosphorylase [Methanobacteriota archaeon]